MSHPDLLDRTRILTETVNRDRDFRQPKKAKEVELTKPAQSAAQMSMPHSVGGESCIYMLRSSATPFVVALCLLLVPLVVIAADGDLTRYGLSNGLEIYIYEKHNVPIAAVQVWYRTGSLNEQPGNRGISHLFEHMMFRGSDGFGPEEHSHRIDDMGGAWNAVTTDDYTYYYQLVPISGIDIVLRMEADRMARLKIDESMLDTERDVVKEEFLLYENDPYAKLLLDLRKSAFGSHPYSWDPLGVKEDLDAIGVDDCIAYYSARYSPNNAALIVVGDVVPDEIFRMAEHHFGCIPSAPSIQPDPLPPVRPKLRTFRQKSSIPVCVSAVGYWLPPAGHEDHVALEALSRLLEPYLKNALIREAKSCLGVFVERDNLRQVSILFFVGAHFSNVPSERVYKQIEESIRDYLANRLTPEELERVRNQILLEEVRKRHSAEGLAEAIGSALFLDGDLDRFSRRLVLISALTPGDLVAVGNRYFVEENRAYVQVEPEHSSKLLYVVGWLKSLFHL